MKRFRCKCDKCGKKYVYRYKSHKGRIRDSYRESLNTIDLCRECFRGLKKLASRN